MTGRYERCVLVAAAAVLLSLALGGAHIWRNVSDPAGELFNKHEWSIVQVLQQRSNEAPFTDAVTTVPNVSDSPDYDAIALPRLDKKGFVWVLSNAAGVPRLKRLPDTALRHICRAELDQVKAAVRLNADVESFLLALTKPDCEN